MVALMLPIVMSAALAQIPDPARAINAAKDARAKTEAAQKKNSDALDPPASAGQSSQGKPPVAAPQGQPPGAPPAPTPPAAPAGAGTQPASGAGQPAQPAGPGYSYDPAGRRDPFVSLLGRGGDLPSSSGSRPAGLPGLLVNEVNLKGVLKANKGDFLALVQAPDNHTYVVHVGDKLLDGVVKAITQDSVVFSQDVNDPLSLVKQREVRKTIRAEGR